MSPRPKALCVIAGSVEGLSIPAVLRDTDFDWKCVIADSSQGVAKLDAIASNAVQLSEVENPFRPVNWFNQSVLDASQRLQALISREAPQVCWIIGAVGIGIVPLQARDTAADHPVRKYLLSPSARRLGANVFPDAAIEDFALGETRRLADVRLDGVKEITGLLRRWTNELAPSPEEKSENPEPLVSVCIPHYNYGAFLEQQLQSLSDQSYGRFEVIVIDDGSQDPESLAVWDKLSKRFGGRKFQFIRRPRNRGLSLTRNEAAERASGEWLVFCDADNRCRPQMLERLVQAAGRTNADVLTCYNHQFRNTAENGEQTVEYYTPVGACLNVGWYANVFGDANSMVRRRAFEAAGGFRSMPGLTAEDWELWARIAWQGGKFAVVPEVLFDYRVHSESVVRTASWKNSVARVHRVYAEQSEELESPVQADFWQSLIAALPTFEQWRDERDANWRDRESFRLERDQLLEELRLAKQTIEGLQGEQLSADVGPNQRKSSFWKRWARIG
ncbi:MAG: glycosyltransferase family 2 protein [Opitutales bacterium]|nr:glycosyltransferase family 2 protein [Opitutales bacterium]